MLKVQVATTPEEKQEIYQFRYKVYIEEMKKSLRYANHIEKTLKDKLDETAILLYIKFEDEIVATVRKNLLSSSSLSENISQAFAVHRFTAAFPTETISFSSRLMVAPQWRNSAVLGMIVMEFYRDARARNLQFDFSHAAPWLVPFYENLGYRRYVDNFFDEDAGLQIPMVLLMEDVEHLRAVHSPFYRVARKASNASTAKNWFNQEFPEHKRLINTCRSTVDEVWEFWVAKLHQQSNPNIELFQGLTDQGIQQLLKSSFFHGAKAGETLLRNGDIANAVFLVLSGVVEVSNANSGSKTLLGSYQTFGEATLFTQLPSPEQAIATTDVEVLVLPVQTVMKAMKTSPESMCQFFFNASRWICKKYVPQANQPAEITRNQLLTA
ncbi:cyclic nucleotide-binding domain-containing protein [Phormidium tenue FACHB-886]|nr:cyclic nucleotide-binding domain-containing protein [Phormidium tenue FACHB-886]